MTHDKEERIAIMQYDGEIPEEIALKIWDRGKDFDTMPYNNETMSAKQYTLYATIQKQNGLYINVLNKDEKILARQLIARGFIVIDKEGWLNIKQD